MFRKFLLLFKTKIILKTNNAIRISKSYKQTQNIGIIFTYNGEKNRILINKFLNKIEQEGKKVQLLAYIPKIFKEETFDFPNFMIKDMDFLRDFNNSLLSQFEQNVFDYLINADIQSNIVIENVLANSKSKCRVGRYQKNKHDFYELMIDYKGNNHEQFLVQVYHYIKNIRNG